MAQIACHTWAYDHLPLRSAIGTIARLGFRAVDIGSGSHLNLGQVAHNPEYHAREVRQMLADFNVWVSDVYLVMTLINSPDPTVRNMRLRLFDRLLDFAKLLGVSGITISPGLVHPDGWEHSFARAIPCLQYMADLAKSRALRISFESHLDSIAPNPHTAQLLMEAVPDLRLTLDIAHWVAQGIAWEAIEPLLPRVAHVHLRQATTAQLQTPYKQGTVDVRQLVDALAAVDYNGVITLEYMNTIGWHGMMQVDVARELIKLRDELRAMDDKS